MNEPIEEKNAINPNYEEQQSNNKTNIFNLVIGIATLLIALLGATFAYFSATARSEENDVTVKSAYVSISYTRGTEIKASNLIPATQNVVTKKYQKEVAAYDPEVDGEEIITDYDTYVNDIARKCVDAKGKEVCYVYEFSIESDGAVGEETDILAYLKINVNEFESLSYVLYEVTFKEEEGTVLTDKYGFGIVDTHKVVSKFARESSEADKEAGIEVNYEIFERPYDDIDKETGANLGTKYPIACLFGYNEELFKRGEEFATDDPARCQTYGVTNKEKHTYQLLIWLNETGFEQQEQGKTFQGTVTIEVSGGENDTTGYENGQITGQE